MKWFISRLLDRFLVKAATQAALDIEAGLTVEICESRASLLRKAHYLEQEGIPGFDQIAAHLRAHAIKMGGPNSLPGEDAAALVGVLRGEDLREEREAINETQIIGEEASSRGMPALPAPEKKRRGRPPKNRCSQICGTGVDEGSGTETGLEQPEG